MHYKHIGLILLILGSFIVIGCDIPPLPTKADKVNPAVIEQFKPTE